MAVQLTPSFSNLESLKNELSAAMDVALQHEADTELGLAVRLAIRSLGLRLYSLLADAERMDVVLFEVAKPKPDWAAAFDVVANVWSNVIPGWDI